MGKYIVILDVGTTNIKSFLFDKKGAIVDQVVAHPKYIMEEKGQMEQDPMEIWEMSKHVLTEILKKGSYTAKDIEALGISTQRASFMFWDKKTGKIYSNIIGWQDKRCAEFAEKATTSLFFRFVRGISRFLYFFSHSKKFLVGSIMKFDSSFALIRTAYFLDHNPELRKKIKDPKTDIAWGTIDTWILWNLTKGKAHATDYSNASSTGLFDPFTIVWNNLVLNKFKIPEHILPEILNTNTEFGITELLCEGSIPIRSIVADQQSSMFGLGCFEAGEMKVTNGTGTFVDLNTGSKPHPSRRKLYPLIAWRGVFGDETTYKLEGVSHNSGNIIDWIKDELQLFENYEDLEKMAMSVDSTEGVYFLPTFSSGISYPYWDPTARGNIFGINLKTKKEHIIRAVLNGIAFRIKDFVQGIIDDTGVKITRIKADGGVSSNKYLLQFLADILGLEVEYSQNPETTALGAAFIAGLATGYYESIDVVKGLIKIEHVYRPKITEEERKHLYNCWKEQTVNY